MKTDSPETQVEDFADVFFNHLRLLIEHVGDANAHDGARAKQHAATARKHARWLYQRVVGALDPYARDKINELIR